MTDRLARYYDSVRREYLRVSRELDDARELTVRDRVLHRAVGFLADEVLPRADGVLQVVRHRTVARASHLPRLLRLSRRDETSAASGNAAVVDALPSSWTEPQPAKSAHSGHPLLALPPTLPRSDLFDALRGRSSARHGAQLQALTLDEMSALLKFSFGEMPSGKRAQPSGGGMYPLEMYVLVTERPAGSSAHLEPGLFHYDVARHGLRMVASASAEPRLLGDLVEPSSFSAPIYLILTGVFLRNERKYGNYGLELILLEAGHVGQNIYLVAGALGLACRALGAGNISGPRLAALVGQEPEDESFVYAVACGRQDPLSSEESK